MRLPKKFDLTDSFGNSARVTYFDIVEKLQSDFCCDSNSIDVVEREFEEGVGNTEVLDEYWFTDMLEIQCNKLLINVFVKNRVPIDEISQLELSYNKLRYLSDSVRDFVIVNNFIKNNLGQISEQQLKELILSQVHRNNQELLEEEFTDCSFSRCLSGSGGHEHVRSVHNTEALIKQRLAIPTHEISILYTQPLFEAKPESPCACIDYSVENDYKFIEGNFDEYFLPACIEIGKIFGALSGKRSPAKKCVPLTLENFIEAVNSDAEVVHLICKGIQEKDRLMMEFEREFCSIGIAEESIPLNLERAKLFIVSGFFLDSTVKILLRAGAVCVISINTRLDQQDMASAFFTRYLYENLESRSVKEAFEIAKYQIDLKMDIFDKSDLDVCCCAHSHLKDCFFYTDQWLVLHESHLAEDFKNSRTTGIKGGKNCCGCDPTYHTQKFRLFDPVDIAGKFKLFQNVPKNHPSLSKTELVKYFEKNLIGNNLELYQSLQLLKKPQLKLIIEGHKEMDKNQFVFRLAEYAKQRNIIGDYKLLSNLSNIENDLENIGFRLKSRRLHSEFLIALLDFDSDYEKVKNSVQKCVEFQQSHHNILFVFTSPVVGQLPGLEGLERIKLGPISEKAAYWTIMTLEKTPENQFENNFLKMKSNTWIKKKMRDIPQGKLNREWVINLTTAIKTNQVNQFDKVSNMRKKEEEEREREVRSPFKDIPFLFFMSFFLEGIYGVDLDIYIKLLGEEKLMSFLKTALLVDSSKQASEVYESTFKTFFIHSTPDYSKLLRKIVEEIIEKKAFIDNQYYSFKEMVRETDILFKPKEESIGILVNNNMPTTRKAFEDFMVFSEYVLDFAIQQLRSQNAKFCKFFERTTLIERKSVHDFKKTHGEPKLEQFLLNFNQILRRDDLMFAIFQMSVEHPMDCNFSDLVFKYYIYSIHRVRVANLPEEVGQNIRSEQIYRVDSDLDRFRLRLLSIIFECREDKSKKSDSFLFFNYLNALRRQINRSESLAEKKPEPLPEPRLGPLFMEILALQLELLKTLMPNIEELQEKKIHPEELATLFFQFKDQPYFAQHKLLFVRGLTTILTVFQLLKSPLARSAFDELGSIIRASVTKPLSLTLVGAIMQCWNFAAKNRSPETFDFAFFLRCFVYFGSIPRLLLVSDYKDLFTTLGKYFNDIQVTVFMRVIRAQRTSQQIQLIIEKNEHMHKEASSSKRISAECAVYIDFLKDGIGLTEAYHRNIMATKQNMKTIRVIIGNISPEVFKLVTEKEFLIQFRKRFDPETASNESFHSSINISSDSLVTHSSANKARKPIGNDAIFEFCRCFTNTFFNFDKEPTQFKISKKNLNVIHVPFNLLVHDQFLKFKFKNQEQAKPESFVAKLIEDFKVSTFMNIFVEKKYWPNIIRFVEDAAAEANFGFNEIRIESSQLVFESIRHFFEVSKKQKTVHSRVFLFHPCSQKNIRRAFFNNLMNTEDTVFVFLSETQLTEMKSLKKVTGSGAKSYPEEFKTVFHNSNTIFGK